MSRIDDLEKAVLQLSADELDLFRDWFESFDADRFDRKIERDAVAGRLDGLAKEALVDNAKGMSRDL